MEEKIEEFVRLIEDIKKNDSLILSDTKLLKPYLNEYISMNIFNKGDFITHEDDDLNRLIIIITGEFYTSRGSKEGQINIQSIKKGPEFLGIEKAVGEEIDKSDNVATKECVTLSVDFDLFNASLNYPEISRYVIKILCKKLRYASYRNDKLIFNNAFDNLCVYIYEYCKNENTKEHVIDFSTEMLATHIGISTRTLHRAKKKLIEKGFVKNIKGKIVITEEQLKKIEEFCFIKDGSNGD